MKISELSKLSGPTPSSEVKTRKLHGKDMPYVDARYVASTLDSVCGPGHWQSSIRQADYPTPGYAFICRIEIWIDELGQWVGKEDGGGQDAVVLRSSGNQTADENDFKGGASDAFKRAGVQWGIARDLYSEDRPFNEMDLSSGPVANAQVLPPQTSSPQATDQGQASPDQVSQLVKLKNEVFPYSPGEPPTSSFKEFFSWMRENGWDFGKWDGDKKVRYGVNIPSEAVLHIQAKLEQYSEPF